jgi:hypothetical protein
MSTDQQLVDAALRAWKSNADRIEKFFHELSDEQLEREVAPGRNRLIYLWGHLAAVSDRMFTLLDLGPRLHPELDAMFLEKPDRAVPALLGAAEVKRIAAEIDAALVTAFSRLSVADWLAKHSAVTAEDFALEPHRNRYSVLLSRNTHLGFHYGQMILAKPRD